ncbi:MAG: tRNA (N(6)-L-threonylcarbamoyladenosine(37)-C(2))-methylthiotransferase MtaB, partial [Butyrivibrio sp.]|nr:tRNA (N(6)-L-threonylcarbamoyladenosine(37)-C(2))-methylthiotransferase MtaB [Butyrivibrio sp.]
VIVGFPGETEEEFRETVEFVKKIGFYELHVFKYSRRRGTAADKMDGQVAESVKNERSEALLELGGELSLDYRKKYIGRSVKVLLEEELTVQGKKYFAGFTDTYVRVAVENAENTLAPNRIVSVRILGLLGKEMVIGVAEI